MSHDTLANHLDSNFQMMQAHKYSLSDLENMLPWERRVYVGMLVKWVEEQNELIEEQNRQ